MTTKSITNIIFFSILIIFILLCFAQTTNKNFMSLEIIVKNNEHQYIKPKEIYDKIKMGPKKKQGGYDSKDINTRLLEDSLETLSYVRNAEVYLSLNKLTILIQQETPFIRTVVNGDTCFFTEDSVKLNLVDGELPKVLFFIGDISLQPWNETVHLANCVYHNSFLSSIISEISHNQRSEYILHSDLFDFKINIGSVNKLDKKLERIKLFFTAISKDKRLNNDSILIKELNVAYDNQIICVN